MVPLMAFQIHIKHLSNNLSSISFNDGSLATILEASRKHKTPACSIGATNDKHLLATPSPGTFLRLRAGRLAFQCCRGETADSYLAGGSGAGALDHGHVGDLHRQVAVVDEGPGSLYLAGLELVAERPQVRVPE